VAAGLRIQILRKGQAMSRENIEDFVEEDEESDALLIDPDDFDNNPVELWVQGYDEDEGDE
jgi:hypothetical protein